MRVSLVCLLFLSLVMAACQDQSPTSSQSSTSPAKTPAESPVSSSGAATSSVPIEKQEKTIPPDIADLINVLRTRDAAYESYLLMAVEVPAQWDTGAPGKNARWVFGAPEWACFVKCKDSFRKETICFADTKDISSSNPTAYASIYYIDNTYNRTWDGRNNTGIVSPASAPTASPFALSLASFVTYFDKFPYDALVSDSARAGKTVTHEKTVFRSHPCDRVIIPHPENPAVQHVYLLAEDMDHYPIRWEIQGKSKEGTSILVQNETIECEKHDSLYVPKLAVRLQNMTNGIWMRARFVYFFKYEKNPVKDPGALNIAYPSNVLIRDTALGTTSVGTGGEHDSRWMKPDESPTMFRDRGYTLPKLMSIYQEAVNHIPSGGNIPGER